VPFSGDPGPHVSCGLDRQKEKGGRGRSPNHGHDGAEAQQRTGQSRCAGSSMHALGQRASSHG
jgi:hypothetical protein